MTELFPFYYESEDPEPILRDVFPDWATGEGIFDQLGSMPWDDDADVDTTILDVEYFGNHSGGKFCAPLVKYLLDEDTGELTDSGRETLGKVIRNRFLVNWTKLWATGSLVYNPIHNYDMSETTERTLNTTSSESTEESGTVNSTDTKTLNLQDVTTYATTDTQTKNLTDAETINTEDETTFDTSEAETKNLTDAKTLNLEDETTFNTSDTETRQLTDTTTYNTADARVLNTSDAETKNLTSTTTHGKTDTTNTSQYGFNSSSAVPTDIVAETEGGTTTTTETGTDTTLHTGTDTLNKTGTETLAQTGTDIHAKTGTETLAKTGTESETHTGTDTTAKTGTETVAHTGTDTTTHTGTDTLAKTGTESEAHTGTDASVLAETNSQDKSVEGTTEESEEVTLTRSGNIGVTTTQQMIEQERELWKWNFFEQVFCDIDKILTLAFHDACRV